MFIARAFSSVHVQESNNTRTHNKTQNGHPRQCLIGTRVLLFCCSFFLAIFFAFIENFRYGFEGVAVWVISRALLCVCARIYKIRWANLSSGTRRFELLYGDVYKSYWCCIQLCVFVYLSARNFLPLLSSTVNIAALFSSKTAYKV